MNFTATPSVSHDEAANLIVTCGANNTFLFQAQLGVGKSALLKTVQRKLKWEPEQFVYIDGALLDLGDLQMPLVDKDTNTVRFVPNVMFAHNKPVVVMLDELGKAMRPVFNALLTMLLEHRVGNTRLPEGSIVFATTNLATDGVGDAIQAHARNRITTVRYRNPTADEWINWASTNDVAPEVMAWVNEYPHCLDSYADAPDGVVDNPYIFDPRKQQTAYVTPRSLELASHIIKRRANIPQAALIAALSGTIGESAARDMQAYLDLADALPSWAAVMRDPDTTPVPDNPIACTILALGAVTRMTAQTVEPWMTYMVRLPKEIQFLFSQQAVRNPGVAATLHKSAAYRNWATENLQYI